MQQGLRDAMGAKTKNTRDPVEASQPSVNTAPYSHPEGCKEGKVQAATWLASVSERYYYLLGILIKYRVCVAAQVAIVSVFRGI